MNDNLLREFLHRWDANRLRFRVRVKTVVFKHVNICLALGLPIVGEPLPKSIDKNSHVRALFDVKKIIDVKSVHSKLVLSFKMGTT